jgi:hypothetical protein
MEARVTKKVDWNCSPWCCEGNRLWPIWCQPFLIQVVASLGHCCLSDGDRGGSVEWQRLVFSEDVIQHGLIEGRTPLRALDHGGADFAAFSRSPLRRLLSITPLLFLGRATSWIDCRRSLF